MLLAACAAVAGHYVGAGLAIRNGSRIVRPAVLLVLGLSLFSKVEKTFVDTV